MWPGRDRGPPAMVNPLDKLSLREREILRLVAKGLANKEIAVALEPVCSAETVKTHLKDIYRKLDVRNRAGAAVLWVGLSGG